MHLAVFVLNGVLEDSNQMVTTWHTIKLDRHTLQGTWRACSASLAKFCQTVIHLQHVECNV